MKGGNLKFITIFIFLYLNGLCYSAIHDCYDISDITDDDVSEDYYEHCDTLYMAVPNACDGAVLEVQQSEIKQFTGGPTYKVGTFSIKHYENSNSYSVIGILCHNDPKIVLQCFVGNGTEVYAA